MKQASGRVRVHHARPEQDGVGIVGVLGDLIGAGRAETALRRFRQGQHPGLGDRKGDMGGDAPGRRDLKLPRPRPRAQGRQQDRAGDLCRAADDKNAPAPLLVIALVVLWQRPFPQQGRGNGSRDNSGRGGLLHRIAAFLGCFGAMRASGSLVTSSPASSSGASKLNSRSTSLP